MRVAIFLRLIKSALALVVALVLNAFPAYAQVAPDGGLLRQQIEQGNKSTRPPLSLPSRAAPLEKLSGATVVVNAFKFVGNSRISTEILQSAVAPYLNKSLDFNQLQDAIAAVGKVYREEGWIVRVYYPQQEIENGIVTIEVIEAIFGGVRFEGNPSKRIANNKVRRYVDAVQKEGEGLNALAVDRALLLLSDIPGVAVSGNLREGQSSDQTDLVLRADDGSLLSGDVALDNFGGRSTGSGRLVSNVKLNSLLERGDQLNTNLMATEGSNYVRLGLSIPVGYEGWRIGASGSYMTYRLVTPEFRSLGIAGASSSYGLDASYPLVRSRLANLYFSLNFENKYFNNEANGAVTTRYVTDALSVGLNGSLTDRFAGGGVSSLGLTWAAGGVNLNGSPNQAADASTLKVAGAFNKLIYAASRLQAVTENAAVYAGLSGQWGNKNLDSSEKFYLGGANGVRAYPSSEGGGTDGQLVNIEIRTQLPNNVGLIGFFDWGHVTANRNNGFIGASPINSYSLQGGGASLSWSAERGMNIKVTWAHRIGNNPNPTAAGLDQDGTMFKDRFWLQLTMPFKS